MQLDVEESTPESACYDLLISLQNQTPPKEDLLLFQ